MKIIKKILMGIFGVALVILVGIFGVYKYTNKVQNVPLKGSNEELNISEETRKKSKEQNIENILLLGVDNEENATDSIMILSLDKDDNTAKLTSIMRDMYVDNGEGKVSKINYAYHYGGVESTVSKLNQLFDLDISKYALINFQGLENIVDYLGGVNVNITDEERIICGANKSGDVNLNGKQALEFSRIRKIDSDFNRTSRQREVMLAILNKSRNISLSNYPKMISDLSSNVKTNLTTTEMLSIAQYLISLDQNNLDEFRIPIDGSTHESLSGIYYLYWDNDINAKKLHEFIY